MLLEGISSEACKEESLEWAREPSLAVWTLHNRLMPGEVIVSRDHELHVDCSGSAHAAS